MNRQSWQGATLLAATLTTGLTAGFFYAWDVSVAPGLTRLDDRAFVVGFRSLDRAVITSPVFMLAFLGASVLIGIAAVLSLRDRNRSPLPWVALAFGLYLAVVVITLTIHEPLNMILRHAGDPDRITDPVALRAAFHETRWAAWNIVRTVATTAAFACLARALVLHGRATVPERRHPSPARPTAEASRPHAALPDEPRRYR